MSQSIGGCLERGQYMEQTVPAGASLLIRGSESSLFHVAIAGVIRQLWPGVSVSFAEPDPANAGLSAARVDYDGRWMCILRQESDVDEARSALAAGAWCLTSLDAEVDQFRRTMEELLFGTPHNVPVTLARRITGAPGPEPAVPKQRSAPMLTARERDVLALLAQGMSNAEIATELGISVHTVRTHLASMATKVDAHNRILLISRARELGYREAGTI